MLKSSFILVYLFTMFITYALCKVSDEVEKIENMRLRNKPQELYND